jgi:hypothetical protein
MLGMGTLCMLVLNFALGVAVSSGGGARDGPAGLGTLLDQAMACLKDSAAPGALGRFTSVLMLHPLDTLRTRAQVVSTASRRQVELAVYRSPGTFSGYAPAVAGQVANAMLTCIGYELWKGWSMEFAAVRHLALGTICCRARMRCVAVATTPPEQDTN